MGISTLYRLTLCTFNCSEQSQYMFRSTHSFSSSFNFMSFSESYIKSKSNTHLEYRHHGWLLAHTKLYNVHTVFVFSAFRFFVLSLLRCLICGPLPIVSICAASNVCARSTIYWVIGSASLNLTLLNLLQLISGDKQCACQSQTH